MENIFSPRSPYEYSNVGVDVIPSQFSTHFIYRNDNNLLFQLLDSKLCLLATPNKWELVFILICVDRVKIFKTLCRPIICMANCEAMTSPTHSFEYSLGSTGQKKNSQKYVKFQNVITCFISYLIFIIFAPIFRNIFTLSFEIIQCINSWLDMSFIQ